MAVPAFNDVTTGAPGLIVIEDYQVLSAFVFGSLRARSASFFMGVFPVDDGGKALARVALDSLPNGDDRAAGSIDHEAALVLQLFVFMDGRAEGGNQDHIIRGDVGKLVGIGRRTVDELDTHLPEPQIHPRIMNYLVGQENTPIRKLSSRFVGQVECEVNAVAKAEFLREPEVKPADFHLVAQGLDLLDQSAVIVGHQRIPDLSLETKPSPDNIGLSAFRCAHA